MQRILIMGATSAIAEATARIWAARGDALMLAARNPQRLQAIAQDLRVRGASTVDSFVIDAVEFARFPALLAAAEQSLGGIDAALIAHGVLPEQAACEQSLEQLRAAFEINALSYMTLSTVLAEYFAAQRRGVIAVISSVAGDRGRQSNYVYGAARATVTAFASGLRQKLFPRGVRVLTIKPGFVDTPMTAAFPKGILWASPQRVARDIVRAMDGGRAVLYTPWFWRPIMAVINSIPEAIFCRLRL
jgi:decaprenylphospho-beta-D-erythro-pentofuranosid-2-ulose 2-reductase